MRRALLVSSMLALLHALVCLSAHPLLRYIRVVAFRIPQNAPQPQTFSRNPKLSAGFFSHEEVRAWHRGCRLPPLPPMRSYHIMVRAKRTLSTCTIMNALHIAVLEAVRSPRRPNTRSFQGRLDKTAYDPPAVESRDHRRNRQCIPGSMIWCPVAHCGAPAHRPIAPPPSRLALLGSLEYIAVKLSYAVRRC